jgi:hypothetical protein
MSSLTQCLFINSRIIHAMAFWNLNFSKFDAFKTVWHNIQLSSDHDTHGRETSNMSYIVVRLLKYPRFGVLTAVVCKDTSSGIYHCVVHCKSLDPFEEYLVLIFRFDK